MASLTRRLKGKVMPISSENMVRGLLLAFVGAGFAGGCTEGLRYQRIKDADSLTAYPATGGVVVGTTRDSGKAICVAPPAQGAMNVDLNVKHDGKVNVLKYVEVESQNAVDLTKTLAKLYEQNERTLFLQFSLYRLCEAYANGMLDEETFGEAMARESLALLRASTEAAARHEVALKHRDTTRTERDGKFDFYKQALDDIEKAERALESAGKTSPSVPAQGRAAGGSQKGGGSKSDKPPLSVTQAETNLADAKKRLTSDEWKAADRAVREAAAAETALVAAEAEAKSLKDSYDYAKKLADDAQNYEKGYLNSAAAKARPLAARRLLSRQNYARLFERVLTTAESLGKQQVEIARAEAEKAKIEAEAAKAKAEAEKAKANEELKKTAAKLEELQEKLLDAAMTRARGCGDECDGSEPAKPKDGK